MKQQGLREGFTTGSAASAAAGAALSLLLDGQHSTSIDIPLPPFASLPEDVNSPDFGRRRTIPVLSTERMENMDAAPSAIATIVKDGGDDPDATHGAHIVATVTLFEAAELTISLEGGIGVGRVTLPGLPVPVGEPAINPEPRKQIYATVREACNQSGYTGGVKVVISVPEGEQRAKKTLNGRLGIVGGISILGTRGTVKPFSHSSWKATISQGMDVAKAAGCDTIAITTGRRSERLLMQQLPNLPELAFIQAADFVAYSLQEAVSKNFHKVAWGCFFGKLVKMAQGHAYTHARTAPIDFAMLATWCHHAGMPEEYLSQVQEANTAMQVLEILAPLDNIQNILESIALRAKVQAETWLENSLPVTIHLFDFDGRELARV